MASVFISYSRVDKELVRRIHAALAEAQREAFVDWEGILPSADYLKEIFDNIEAADTFVAVLSPEWVASESCQTELAHALENRKRIIAIVRREVDPKSVDPTVAAVNWIFFRESDDFDAAFKQLLVALDTDLKYWHQASQILVRARQWEAKRRDMSLTLRGAELAEAEQWLAEGTDKKPRPTPLQTEFITSSRRAANARQRRTVGVLTIGLAVTLALSLVSTNLFIYSNAQKQIAVSKAATVSAQATTVSAQNDQLLKVPTVMRFADAPDRGPVALVRAPPAFPCPFIASWTTRTNECTSHRLGMSAWTRSWRR